MQLIHGAPYLRVTFLFLLFAAAPCAAVLGTVLVPLTCMYASL